MNALLCLIGLHRGLWMPVVTIPSGIDSTRIVPEDFAWLQLRRCVNCGRILGRQPRG